MLQRWTKHYVNLIATSVYCVYLGLFLAKQPLPVILAITVALLAFVFNLWRYLHIAKAPVSTINAAAQGYIELNGVATTAKPMQTPLHGISCVWYRSWAYARDAENFWRLVDYNQSDAPFQLQDHTGTCMVDPKGAEVIYTQKHTSNQHNHRYVEQYLPVNRPLYLIGYLDTRHDFADEKAMTAAVGEVITEWKSDPAQLLMRFDLDKDGNIDYEEWESAREQAYAEATRRQQYQAHTGDFTVSKPSSKQLYLLSGLSPHTLRRHHAWWVAVHIVALVSLIILGSTT